MSEFTKVWTTRYNLWVAVNIKRIGSFAPAEMQMPAPEELQQLDAELSDSKTDAWVECPFSPYPIHMHRSAMHGAVDDAVFWLTYEDACRDILKWRLHVLEHAARHVRALVNNESAFYHVSRHQAEWMDALETLPTAIKACDRLVADSKTFIARMTDR